MYDKPFRTFDEQLALLSDRGLAISDLAQAREQLQRLGYYRLGAYLYPLRQLLPPAERQVVSPVHFRSDQFHPGSTLEHAIELHEFDVKLRRLCADALQPIEIALRTQTAYVLGRRGAFAHLSDQLLDQKRCGELHRRGGTKYEQWQARYQKLATDARREDYMVHHAARYGDPVPIWIAVEFLDFGAVVTLLNLMRGGDRNHISEKFEVRNGWDFHGWMAAMNYLRNVTAHHGRLWNRVLTYKIANPAPQMLGPTSDRTAFTQGRIYGHLAALAHLCRAIDATSSWPDRAAKLLGEFPTSVPLDGAALLGLPARWQEAPIWASNASTCKPSATKQTTQ